MLTHLFVDLFKNVNSTSHFWMKHWSESENSDEEHEGICSYLGKSSEALLAIAWQGSRT